jgi:hypothetical protein
LRTAHSSAGLRRVTTAAGSGLSYIIPEADFARNCPGGHTGDEQRRMQTITVTHTIKASPEKIFDILADHANYKLFPGISDSKLLTPGKRDKNGIGAVRQIDAGRARFVELITRYKRPLRLDYRIVKSFPPVQHEGGSVKLEQIADGTRVTWTSTIRLRLPLVGQLLTPLLTAQLSKGFLQTLQAIDKRLVK